jgi:Fe-S-cluster containining protein
MDCQRCGACCSQFRVSFYWAETDEAPGGTVPLALTQVTSPHTRCMQGTWAAQPRCAALEGQVGEEVGCRIYAQRPSPCREVTVGDAQCLRAREAHGLSVS